MRSIDLVTHQCHFVEYKNDKDVSSFIEKKDENIDEKMHRNVVEQIERWINEFENSSNFSSTEIGRQFADLQRIQDESKQILTVIEAEKEENRLKNRYVDILPYDRSRVVLRTDNDGDDYINASFVEDLSGHRRYIAAQGPFDRSIVDFCRMIWQLNITTIICLAKEIEGDRVKFCRYWPIDSSSSIEIGPFLIIRQTISIKNDYEKHSLLIRRNGIEQRRFCLYHFSKWFDHDIPDNNESIENLLNDVYENRQTNDKTPLLVHCSAGCGRTGTLIAIDLCRLWFDDQVERRFLSKFFVPLYLVFHISSFIRRYRIALIQTVKQFYFVYKYFLRLIERRRSISSEILCS